MSSQISITYHLIFCLFFFLQFYVFSDENSLDSSAHPNSSLSKTAEESSVADDNIINKNIITVPTLPPVQKTEQELLNEQLQHYYQSNPPAFLKLNLISYYKKVSLFSHFSFETDHPDKITDESSGETSFHYHSGLKNPLVFGKAGTGIYTNPETQFEFDPLKLRLPRNLTIQFDIFPLQLRTGKKALFSLFQATASPVLQAIVVDDEIFFQFEDSPVLLETGFILGEKNWQNMLISFDFEEYILYVYKNNHLLKKIPCKINATSKFKMMFGKTDEIPGVVSVMDDIKFYRFVFSEPPQFPVAPGNPAFVIKEGYQFNDETMNILLFCENASEYIISNSPDFIDARWLPFKQKITFPARLVSGEHIVYCKFKNDSSLETPVITQKYLWGNRRNEIEFLNPIEESIIPGKR